jgi:ATP/maltotriose-dependent transcriptional regulator MalT
VRAASILHNNAANVLFNMNCPEEALEHYMAAIAIDMRSSVVGRCRLPLSNPR